MTETDEKNRVILHTKIARVSKERLDLLVAMKKVSISNYLDTILEEQYNRAVADNELREYMKRLQSLDDDIVSK